MTEQAAQRKARRAGGLARAARRYEVRIAGRLSTRARQAFVSMIVVEPAVETVLYNLPDGSPDLGQMLTTIQNLGLHVLSIQEVPE